MSSLPQSVLLASALSLAAGAAGALAVSRALTVPETRDPAELPEFEDRFMREFDLPESKRALVRTILRDDREQRRVIEGAAVTTEPSPESLRRTGYQVDQKLRGILPPPQRTKYDQWIARSQPPAAR